jgi:hypothetical protein
MHCLFWFFLNWKCFFPNYIHWSCLYIYFLKLYVLIYFNFIVNRSHIYSLLSFTLSQEIKLFQWVPSFSVGLLSFVLYSSEISSSLLILDYFSSLNSLFKFINLLFECGHLIRELRLLLFWEVFLNHTI